MDLNDYWQENKRFLTGVAAGGVVFLIGLAVIDSVYGSDLKAARRTVAELERKLGEPMYQQADLVSAREENERLEEAVATLASHVGFQAREDFRLRPDGGSASSQYHGIVASVRERVLERAARANVALEKSLGLPALSPTREDEIVRYLEALDAVERAVELAIACRVDMVDQIRIKLDPSLSSKQGLGRVERTRVELEMAGTGLALERWLARIREADQHAHGQGASLITEVALKPSPSKLDEARLQVVLSVARLRDSGADRTEEEA